MGHRGAKASVTRLFVQYGDGASAAWEAWRAVLMARTAWPCGRTSVW